MPCERNGLTKKALEVGIFMLFSGNRVGGSTMLLNRTPLKMFIIFVKEEGYCFEEMEEKMSLYRAGVKKTSHSDVNETFYSAITG